MRGVCWIVLGFKFMGKKTGRGLKYYNSTGYIMLVKGGWAFIVSVQRLHLFHMNKFLAVTPILITM